MRQPKASSLLLIAALSGGWLATSCSSSSSSTGSDADFQLVNINLSEGDVWRVNRPIEFRFSAPVDFLTVTPNTINIRTASGAPATGSYSLLRFDGDGDGILESVDETTVVFQPTCPVLADLSDAGLLPGAVPYVLTVFGLDSNPSATVRSQAGANLRATQTRRFVTPTSNDPSEAFIDTNLEPPVPVVRAVGSANQDATYIEIGGDPSNRVYFEFDEATQSFSTDPSNFISPLNLYGDEDARIAYVLEFNQPLNPSAGNVSSDLLRIEFRDAAGGWVPVETRVELVANCTESGARVRLEPVGVLPPASRVRATVRPGFQDLVGQSQTFAVADFGELPTQSFNFAGLTPSDEKADEFFESFDFGGEARASFQDTDALFEVPVADWSGGRLAAAFDFDGTGGPGGNFDWVIAGGEEFIFDTTSATIVGGPGGAPETVVNVANGLVDLRNFTIEPGGVLRVQGPNPFFINATGTVAIRGILDASGMDAVDVADVDTGDQIEVGAPGAAGGGRGGNASENVKGSTARGGYGQGPFGQPMAGGQGGESGFADITLLEDARRPGGGGGGVFSEGSGEAGEDGSDSARGAITLDSPPLGGLAGAGPFVDGDGTNDFYGVRPVAPGGTLSLLIRGELTEMLAGFGGGGGGDAVPSNAFPAPNWTPAHDEKGGAGGGGGGAVRIRALGDIVFGVGSRLLANGGTGAFGENVQGQDHIGGTGGSGSGGHVILETAGKVDFTDGDPNPIADEPYVQARGGVERDGTDDEGVEPSGAGAGGSGLIQIHVPDPISEPGPDPLLTDIVITSIAGGDLGRLSVPEAIPMVPLFGAKSRARSEWISIGGRRPAGQLAQSRSRALSLRGDR